MLLGCALMACNGCMSTGDVIELDSVEVREYEGEQLSSVNNFRENSIKGPQYVDVEDYQLEITGLVEQLLTFTYDEIIEGNEHYKKVVTLDCVEGWSVTILWEGVLVRELIQQASASDDAKVVILHAYDGYTTSFPLEYLMDNDILMAYKMNDVTLPFERGFPRGPVRIRFCNNPSHNRPRCRFARPVF